MVGTLKDDDNDDDDDECTHFHVYKTWKLSVMHRDPIVYWCETPHGN